MATVAGIIAVIVAALYVNYRMRPAEIRFECTPDDAEVRVDGERVLPKGNQFVIHELAPDAPHLIEVRKPGYRTWSTRIELRSGQLLHLPRVTLIPSVAPKPPARGAF